MYSCNKDCLILILVRLPQISCFTLSLKRFSSDSDNCPDVGIRPLLQFPYPPRAGPVLLTLLFSPRVPSSCRVLHGSIYSFPLARYSCLLSAGVLHALLYLKVCSWCIQVERDVLHVHLLLHHLVLLQLDSDRDAGFFRATGFLICSSFLTLLWWDSVIHLFSKLNRTIYFVIIQINFL